MRCINVCAEKNAVQAGADGVEDNGDAEDLGEEGEGEDDEAKANFLSTSIYAIAIVLISFLLF